ncbi:uncharacterized protein LOC122388669 isoform X2 [Amphibalanus amphitrite]|uniref:uncharacterized protein LOC122388669 isoform X2 n=1 Tax=Amphibalanus amphitrite TaxID=1232801 RepID=UPI001C913FB6|nr:uncharacterized protein LOC122388669 isoform X2 [Amphibalanus amphitrite]
MASATQPVVRNLDFFSHEESPEYKMTDEDHLHDLRYMKRAEQEQSMEALLRMESDLERLTILVGVMFCLLIVCFVWLAFHACSSRRGRCRRRKTGDVEADAIQLKGVGNGDANDAHPVNAGAPVISSKANTVPQYTLGRHNSSFLMATKHGDELKGDRGRHPSEDTCPGDYSAAYDNPALSMTPPLDGGGATSHPLAAAGAESPPLPPRDVSRASSRRRSGDPRPPRSRDGPGAAARPAPEADVTDPVPPAAR